MYYYGNNGYYSPNMTPCAGAYGSYSNGIGAAIWIVLFILLVIIIGAWGFNNQNNN